MELEAGWATKFTVFGTMKFWDAALSEEDSRSTEGRLPESTAWMNMLLSSVWPLINPDLFASVVDMLEDVMLGKFA